MDAHTHRGCRAPRPHRPQLQQTNCGMSAARAWLLLALQSILARDAGSRSKAEVKASWKRSKACRQAAAHRALPGDSAAGPSPSSSGSAAKHGCVKTGKSPGLKNTEQCACTDDTFGSLSCIRTARNLRRPASIHSGQPAHRCWGQAPRPHRPRLQADKVLLSDHACPCVCGLAPAQVMLCQQGTHDVRAQPFPGCAQRPRATRREGSSRVAAARPRSSRRK